MYLSYFKLKTKPFELVPNPEFMFLGKSHKKAMVYLDYGIRERAGFILLTGEVGSGKTTIIREMIARHIDNVVLSKIFNTNVDSEQLIAMINDDFDLPIQGKDKITLLRDLNLFLVDQYARGNRPVIIIDEAQNLTPETLEEIRMLSNLETTDSKLVQIILVGQPELRNMLAKPEMRQLRQRINIQCHLQPLDRQEVEEYILHRLQVAGNRQALSFDPKAFDIIFTYSCGIPRLINIICDFLLLSAFAEELHDVSEEMIFDIVGDLDFNNHYWAADQHGAEKDKGIGGAVAFPQAAHVPESRIDELFGLLNQRLEHFEKDAVATTQATLKEFNERLMQMQNIFAQHLKKTNSAVAELSQRLEERPRTETTNQEPLENGKGQKPGLIRRIFG